MLDFNSSIVLEDEVARLRPLQHDDFGYLKNFSLQEPELWTFSTKSAAGEDQLQRYIDDALAARARETEYPFIIFDKASGRYAGSTRFYDINFAASSLQLGYTWIGRDFHRSPLNTHCKFLLLDLAFGDLQMQRVEFRADAANHVSIAAMQRLGCRAEGILRSHQPRLSGGRRDTIVLSLLREEWEQGAREKLRRRL